MFQGIILKLTAFCNLNCKYCYMFNLKDTTYNGVPKHLGLNEVNSLINNIDDYISQKKLAEFKLILHGGEPLLWKKENFLALFQKIRNARNGSKIKISLQTNLFQVDWEIIEILSQNNVTLGISIDGPEEFHDEFRISHNNKPSYKKIMTNLDKLLSKGYLKMVGGFLTVSNPLIPPRQYYDWIKQLPVNNVSVLFPIEFNYNHTPWDSIGISENAYLQSPTYGKWFSDLFSLWWNEDNPNVYIRIFYELIGVALGSKKHGDSIVNDKLNMFVVNTDGRVEYHDYFRALKDGIINTKFNIKENSILEIEKDTIFQKLFNLGDHLPKACTKCPYSKECGGGFLAGRLENKISDFRLNNSILCYDYFYLIDSIKQKVNSQKHAFSYEV